MLYETKSAKETQKHGFDLGRNLKTGGVILLFGNLGAGKTTFIQGLARGLGIKQRVNSPTYIIARRYKLPPAGRRQRYLFHVDLYRLTSLSEVKNIGIEEMWENGNVVCIEWPELVEKIAPKAVKVQFNYANEKTRQIEIVY
ncbi:tRNA (adenosine(37)-N6)-threonylcarbamoyltransferase complex ATPase subunit type 1 TsaE [Candidatus Gottesmanbacteria bacterium RIFCSPHIGHO2_01_FULL_42_12]|uniref:tRNA threonylcarbamoyladenosine biosynthesis protein TsaE n=1 Tax=Candidatus Gottesmanbacteria bacterium RIFCSPHIGHO2_01_FULL_42_12 TaxID=1798377 RepID=A0A1F5YZW2_9BACT|nr:MAG: tRNA (adenosine(37)-N6)-threonylcarbamoyltransferase complex ATPase subunit type 1 TsaE [Candidatus Gottesmanbacteria bacterium RIFCSPHIGHO2_01_FULL_42_12]